MQLFLSKKKQLPGRSLSLINDLSGTRHVIGTALNGSYHSTTIHQLHTKKQTFRSDESMLKIAVTNRKFRLFNDVLASVIDGARDNQVLQLYLKKLKKISS